MPLLTYTLALAVVLSVPGLAQDKPTEEKGRTTIIGCLSGPDKDGKYTLRSMSHRTGVEVFGSDDLKRTSGGKVKVTGLWKASDQPAEPGSAKKARKFQVTDLEVMAAKCETPTEKTPISKEKQLRQQQQQERQQQQKQEQQQQQQKQQNSADPAASGDTSNPK